MQDVSFRTVEEFLDYLPEHELDMVERLREIILECLPQCNENLAYNVPFYYLHKRVCFIWPSSIPWGKVPLKGVTIGFSNGYLMQNEDNYLEKGNRKFVYTKTFFNIIEINHEVLSAHLFEAAIIDEELVKAKREAKKKG